MPFGGFSDAGADDKTLLIPASVGKSSAWTGLCCTASSASDCLDQLLLTFLVYSKPLRDFCGFTKVPDASKITRFKQDFLDDLQLVFDQLVDITEPICQAVDSSKAVKFCRPNEGGEI